MIRCCTLLWFALAASPLFGQGYGPDIAPTKMTVPRGFRVQLVASEPDIRQPVAIDFDERGRLWVMQYLQYPNPAGLKRVKVDRFSRTVYDRVPDPPPRGPKGEDRLTILEPDPMRPGKFRSKDFVSGLNLASGFAFGHGGVFILQVPYLLFYPDRDRDDVPDGDPDVLLSGFGMEDAHSVANSLTWGPDGWLYGCQGSTVTANIRGIEFQQGVWRYHPLTRKFELFCEGGGNSWGLDFDRHGNLLYSTNHGGFAMLHGVQGAYYWKAFGKHGALHNPHAYGYFDHVPHENFRGGHVTVGGIMYRGDNFPDTFRDRYIGGDLLGHAVRWHDVIPHGSSFRARTTGDLLQANDTWFAPCDVCLGPDGCVYVADWHDARTAHPDPDAEWDRRNGRVYRISYGEPPTRKEIDLGKLSSSELVKLLTHANDWYARTARRILMDRRDPEVIFPLRTLVRETNTDHTLQYLWALQASGGSPELFAVECLSHANEHVRRWALRFLGDEDQLGRGTVVAMQKLATSESSVVVRSQLASTARRLPGKDAIPILHALANRREDEADPNIPMLIWWGIEQHAVAQRDLVHQLFLGEASPIVTRTLLPRLIRRYAAEGTEACDAICAKFLLGRAGMWSSLEQGLSDRSREAAVSEVLNRVVAEQAVKHPEDATLNRLMARFGDTMAKDRLLEWGHDAKRTIQDRVAAIAAFAEFSESGGGKPLVEIARGEHPTEIRRAALSGWSRIGTLAEAGDLIGIYGNLPAGLRSQLRSTLLGRKAWASLLLTAVVERRIAATEFTTDELLPIATFADRELDAIVLKQWGNVRGATPEAKLAEVRRFNNDLRAGAGDLKAGQILFTKHCAACHKLNSQGGPLGPDLTHANRSDRDYLLVSIIDPNAVIRKEFLSFTAETKDMRLVTGLITAQNGASVTLTNAKGEATTLKQKEISSLRESAVSLMPEGLLTLLKPQELRDLFSYLQAPASKK